MQPFIGEIRAFGFDFPPRGWVKCDGQLLQVSSNTSLFSLLGTTYGGDGRTTFGVPDLRGRVAVHQGLGPGLSNRKMGDKPGTENVTLNVNEIPSHNHAATGLTGVMRCNDTGADQKSPVGATLAQVGKPVFDSEPPDSDMAAGSVGISGHVANNGGSRSHNNIQPSLVVNYCIALVGIFPQRS